MNMIELVIKIPERDYDLACNYPDVLIATYAHYIKDGTPLPKGHGRLIDAGALKMDKRVCGDRYLSGTPLFVANKVIEQAPTIVEADEVN